jgi:hypothetical protein
LIECSNDCKEEVAVEEEEEKVGEKVVVVADQEAHQ